MIVNEGMMKAIDVENADPRYSLFIQRENKRAIQITAELRTILNKG